MPDHALHAQLAAVLAWEDAHVGFDRAVAGVPVELRGRVPKGALHSLWQLVEHLRLAQRDILEFCTDPAYTERRWPDDYWPVDPAPPSTRAWSTSLKGYALDRAALQALAANRTIDLFAQIPHGSGQTYLREILLVADHAAYHIGQIVLVRRMLGIWTM
jgi:hypothetical protein